MTVVKRYHEHVRRAYQIIKREAPGLDREAALQTTVKAVNAYIGPDSLVPTLLAFGALPRLGFPSERPLLLVSIWTGLATLSIY